MSLQTLPIDLLFHISTTYLDYPSIQSLSLTSRSLHAAVNPDTLTPLGERTAFYLRAERYPQHAGKLVCFTCWRFLPADAFGLAKRTGRAGKHGADDGRRGRRFCWECGVGGGMYPAMRPVRRRKGEGLQYPCGKCGVARVKGERCLQEVCVVDAEEDGCGRGLEGLPEGVLRRVCGELGYRDLLSLRRVSRGLRERVEPVGMCRDVYSMWEFVMERTKALRTLARFDWNWARRVRGEPRACFGCFRPRTRDQFSYPQFRPTDKWNKGDYWRSRCWGCLRRFYHPQLADEEARARFDRQIICKVCRGMRYKDKDCGGCFVRRDEIAEWMRLGQEKKAMRSSSNFWEEAETALPLEWFDEGPSSDVWEEGIGTCLERLLFGDEDSRGDETTGPRPLPDASGESSLGLGVDEALQDPEGISL